MLQVDAVVNPTNESLTDKNPITLRLMEIAGPELKEACKTQVGCKCLMNVISSLESLSLSFFLSLA